jgi:hypothetical protein
MQLTHRAREPGEPEPAPYLHRGTLAGWILTRRDGRASAVTRDGLALGLFNSASAAATALIQARAL